LRVKRDNLRLYKCDICGREFSEFDDAQYSHISIYDQGYTEGYDCCPRCTKYIRSIIDLVGNGYEPIISYR
jgi:hypothetical protein